MTRPVDGLLPVLGVTPVPPGFAPSQWNRPDGWLLAYLCLPLPVFLLGFFSPWLGIPAAAMAFVAFVTSRPFASAAVPRRDGRALVGALMLIIFAAAWTSLGLSL